MTSKRDKIAIIIGAGPAGLSTAYHLLKTTDDIKPIIFEELDTVGGISRTIFFNGNGIDLGGHRLYTKNQEVLKLWNQILPLQGQPPIDYKILKRNITTSANGPDPDKTDKVMLKRKRISRILYMGKFFDYPLSLKIKTLLNMGIRKTYIAGISYLKSKLKKQTETTLEDFIINRFGQALYEMFFEKYTEKVWGLHPRNISKEWGEQRIKGVSLSKAILHAILSPFNLTSISSKETSLIDEFYYPKLGCGQLWEELANQIQTMGGEIHLKNKVISLLSCNNEIKSLTVLDESNTKQEHFGDYFISSMPIKDLISGLGESVPETISKTCLSLRANIETLSISAKDRYAMVAAILIAWSALSPFPYSIERLVSMYRVPQYKI